MGLEFFIQWKKGKIYYRFNDTLSNLSCGINQQVLAVMIKGLLIWAYIWIYNQNFLHFRFPLDSIWTWLLLFIGVDFFYYWFHRAGHEMSVIWGGHVVHHQSEEYNLSVALRQGAFQAFFSWVFYLPLAVLGFDSIMFVVVNQFQTLYQFWIHTRTINKMPKWFEYIFNTPSHHRVHHGINPQYIDKNHGGTFIIWDRLFGSFQPEEEEVVYGITKPLNSWNPVWANLDYFRDLFSNAFRAQKVTDFLKVFYKGPGWVPAYLGAPPQPKQPFVKYDNQIPKRLNYYILSQYVILLGLVSAYLLMGDKFSDGYGEARSQWAIVLGGLLIFISSMSLGGMLELKKWSPITEIIRLPAISLLIWPIFSADRPLLYFIISLSLILLSLAWLWKERKAFILPTKPRSALQ